MSDEGAATVVSSTPKKDTVRIEIPKAKGPTPQATVKLQTQPLMRAPAAEMRTLAVPATSSVVETSVAAEDPMMTYASIGVLVFSVIVLISQILNYISLSGN